LSKLDLYEEDKAYRIYVTDALKIIGSLNGRYIDFIKAKRAKVETRTPEEIIATIRRKINGSV